MSDSHALLAIKALVEQAREACQCLSCGGAREIGGHTIATPDSPRRTPMSCLAPTVLDYLLEREEP